jgi:hypothetical protein
MMHEVNVGSRVHLDNQIRIHDSKNRHRVFHRHPPMLQEIPELYRASVRSQKNLFRADITRNYDQMVSLIMGQLGTQTRGPLSYTKLHLVYAASNISAVSVVDAIQPPHDQSDTVRHIAVIVRGLQYVLACEDRQDFQFQSAAAPTSCAAAIEVPFELPQLVHAQPGLYLSWMSYAVSYVLLNSDTDGDLLLRYISKLTKTESLVTEDEDGLAHRVSHHPSFLPIVTLVMRNSEQAK